MVWSPREGGTLTQRPWVPAAVSLTVWASAWATYNLSPGLPAVLHLPAAAAAGALMFAAVHLSAPAVWPLTRLRGASVGAALLAAYATPVAWIGKECLRLLIAFRWWESLYYALNPLLLASLCATAAGCGIGELVARGVRRRRGEAVAVVHWAPILAIVGGLGLLAAMFGRTMGEEAVYTWLAGYRAIPGAGD